MIKLFYEGGSLFMSILTLELLLVVLFSVLTILKSNTSSGVLYLNYLKPMGNLSLVTGLFGQLIGLYLAFEAISQAGGVLPKVLFQGLKVSSIPSLYGLLIFIIAYVFWLALSHKNFKETEI